MCESCALVKADLKADPLADLNGHGQLKGDRGHATTVRCPVVTGGGFSAASSPFAARAATLQVMCIALDWGRKGQKE